MTFIPINLFDYNLPENLIAQRPADLRSASKLLRLDRKEMSIEHNNFSRLPDFLREGVKEKI